MKKSLLLLASFAGFVACPGDNKKEEPVTETTETCPAEAPVAPAVVAPEAAPAAEPAAEPAK